MTQIRRAGGEHRCPCGYPMEGCEPRKCRLPQPNRHRWQAGPTAVVAGALAAVLLAAAGCTGGGAEPAPSPQPAPEGDAGGMTGGGQ